ANFWPLALTPFSSRVEGHSQMSAHVIPHGLSMNRSARRLTRRASSVRPSLGVQHLEARELPGSILGLVSLYPAALFDLLGSDVEHGAVRAAEAVLHTPHQRFVLDHLAEELQFLGHASFTDFSVLRSNSSGHRNTILHPSLPEPPAARPVD